jgi:hypothetical protein
MALKTVDRLNMISKEITSKKLVEVGYPVFLKNTPVRSGNARKKTVNAGTEIDANYPYAVGLDQGRSKQSPTGMVKPTIYAVRLYIRKLLGT